MRTLAQAIVILFLAALLGVASFFARPDAIPWSASEHEIDLATATSWQEAIWIDARLDEEYEQGHYADALSLNEENWEQGFAPLLDVWEPGRPIIVYCSSQSCLRSHHVAERLRAELGADQVFVLRGGWEELQEAAL